MTTRDEAQAFARRWQHAHGMREDAEITARGTWWWLARTGGPDDVGSPMLVIRDDGLSAAFLRPVSPWFDNVKAVHPAA